jgi:hypothetical protein
VLLCAYGTRLIGWLVDIHLLSYFTRPPPSLYPPSRLPTFDLPCHTTPHQSICALEFEGYDCTIL